MKITKRTVEWLARSTAAFFLIMMLILRKDSEPLIKWLIADPGTLFVVRIVLWVLVFWLAFGRLMTPPGR